MRPGPFGGSASGESRPAASRPVMPVASLIPRLLAAPLDAPLVVGRDFEVHAVDLDQQRWVIKVVRADESGAVMTRRERLLENEQAVLVALSGRVGQKTGAARVVPELIGMARLPDGRACLIRRWVDGLSLAELVERALTRRRFQGARRWNMPTRGLVQALGAAVHALHRAGFAHNDLKPEDILVRFDPEREGGRFEVTLLDLGLAAAPGHSGDGGTVCWAAPERLEGAPGTVASDVWALGALVYLLLTGRAPYPEGEEGQVETAARDLGAPEPGPADLPQSGGRPRGHGGVPERARAIRHGNAVDARLARQSPVEVPRNQAALLAWQDLGRHGDEVGVPITEALARAMAKDPKARPKDVPALLGRLGLKLDARSSGPPSSSSRPRVVDGATQQRSPAPGWGRRALWGGLIAAATALGFALALGPVGSALGFSSPRSSDAVACEVARERAERLCVGTSAPARCVDALIDEVDCRAQAALLGACGGP